MRHYETTYVLRPNIGEDQFTEIIERTNKIITDDGGVIISQDRWGMKKLAYEIKKEVQGYYIHLNYAAPGKTIAELERIFRIDDRLLRFLTIKLSDMMNAEAIALEKQRIQEIAAQAAAEEAEPEEAEADTETAEAKTEKAEADTEKAEAAETVKTQE
jgi:small subunit ribosomal protein S6